MNTPTTGFPAPTREGADLIVAGWRGTVTPEEVRGSVAQELLRRAGQDVYVVQPGGEDGVDEIIVGVSPGIRSPDAVRAAAALAVGTGAPLRLLTVHQPGQGERDDLAQHLEASP